MGADAGPPGAPWRASAHEWFATHVKQPDRFAAFVAETPEGDVVACAAGVCSDHPPSPSHPSSLRGHLFSVCTESAYRRRGLARACVTALLEWYRNDTSVGLIELHASDDGDALYRELGFKPHAYPTLRLHLR
jgi:GNAT superfamily N-acetyltransferase